MSSSSSSRNMSVEGGDISIEALNKIKLTEAEKNEVRKKLSPGATSVDLTGALEPSQMKALCYILENEKQFSSVKELKLTDNIFSNTDCVEFAQFLESADLETLDLSKTTFPEGGFQSITVGLGSNYSLKTLILEDNHDLKEDDIRGVANMLSENGVLECLDMSGVKLGESKMTTFLEGLEKNESLKELRLENIHIQVPEAKELTACLKKSECKIKTLTLDYNQFCVNYLARTLLKDKMFPHLIDLSFSYCFDASSGRGRVNPLQIIFNSFRGNRTLRKLSLKGNNIQDPSCNVLFGIIKMPSRLEELDLLDNNIDVNGIRALMPAISQNAVMKKITLEGNRFMDNKEAVEAWEDCLEQRRKRLEGSKLTVLRNASLRMSYTQTPSGNFRREDGLNSKLKRISNSRSKGRLGSDNGVSDGSLHIRVKTKKKPKKKRAFAYKLDFMKPERRGSPQSYNNNLDSDEASVVFHEPKKKKKNFAKKLKNLLPVTRPKEVETGSFNDNLDDDFISVIVDSSPSTEPTKRKIAGKKRFQKLRKNFDLKKYSVQGIELNNNFDDDSETCVVATEAKVKAELLLGKDAIDNDDVFSDYDSDGSTSVILVDTDNEAKTLAVKEGLRKARNLNKVFSRNGSEKGRNMSKPSPKGKRVKSGEDDFFDERFTHQGDDAHTLKKIGKSELGFINHVKRMMNKEERPGEESASVLRLSKEDLNKLELMLSDFTNLLDRDEHFRGSARIEPNKRRFAEKLGVIGRLNKNKSKVVDPVLAKSVYDQYLISRQLVRNVTLVNMFTKLRMEIGNGVPTRLAGMLPSKLFDNLTADSETVVIDGKEEIKFPLPSIEKLECYAASLLLIKVVLWSIFKALAISKPEVDPEGRNLLAKFGKTMINKKYPSEEYVSDNDTEAQRKKSELGENIVVGAFFELIDVLLLLRPMYAMTEALLLTVRTQERGKANLMEYTKLYERMCKRASKKLKENLKKQKAIQVFKQVMGKKKKNNKVNSSGSGNNKKVLNSALNFAENKMKKKKSKNSPKKKEKGVPVDKLLLLYRKNCPERVQNVLNDIEVESQSLLTMLSIDQFLPTLFSLCSFEDVSKHYKKRFESINPKIPNWLNALYREFKNQTIEHVMPLLEEEMKLPPLESLMKPESKKQPRSTNIEPQGELLAVFAQRAKNGNRGTIGGSKPVLGKLKDQKSISGLNNSLSFYHPVLNQLFGANELSKGAARQIREMVRAKTNDKDKSNRTVFIEQLKVLCLKGCDDTSAKTTLDVLKANQAQVEIMEIAARGERE